MQKNKQINKKLILLYKKLNNALYENYTIIRM